MKKRFFFGYGSLVNRATHDFTGARPAQIRGWRRAWRATPIRAVSFLTVVPAPGHKLLGLIAPVPDNSWDSLDLRERAYDRYPAHHAVIHDLPHKPEIAIYAIPEGKHSPPTPENPILLSYLDVVLQGYLREFGPDGVEHFFDTTDGWEAPVIDDRAAPRYPRAAVLSKSERRTIDAVLEKKDLRFIAPQGQPKAN